MYVAVYVRDDLYDRGSYDHEPNCMIPLVQIITIVRRSRFEGWNMFSNTYSLSIYPSTYY